MNSQIMMSVAQEKENAKQLSPERSTKEESSNASTSLRKRRSSTTQKCLIESPSKKTKTMMEVLECPVCFEIPRGGPIYGCTNGHHLCQSCSKRIQTCPVCKDTNLKCRNVLAEKMVEVALKDVPIKCKFVGCDVHNVLGEISEHEKLCPFRIVACPSFHRGACDWHGPLNEMVKHIKEKKCVQVVFDAKWHAMRRKEPQEYITEDEADKYIPTFNSTLGDFADGVSVFNRSNVVTHWKPIVLLAKKLLNLWCYAVVQRDSQGQWMIVVRAMLPQQFCDKIRCKITVKGPDSETPNFSYEGKVSSYELTREQVLENGQYLHLLDGLIKPFKKGTANTLFSYKVEVETDQELEREMYKLLTASANIKSESIQI